ncbi:MAG: radical SAM protein [Elusimicrobiales bacterium]|nr:radical SAM protein [Elusimicrobiales bacterium]
MNKIISHNLKVIKKITNKNNSDILKKIINIKWHIDTFPQTCEITVTSKCNLNCKFCYNEKDLKFYEPDIKTITNSLIFSRKNGAWICVIIGGEATLRKDITLIGSIAKKIGYECIKICTNGQKLADENFLKKLIKYGFNMFDITLMSINEKIHDYLTGTKGSYKNIMKALNNLKKNNCEIGINTVINKLNYKDFPELINLTYNNLDINYYNIIFGHYDGSFKKNIKELSVSYSDVKKYIEDGLKIIEYSKIPAFARILVNFPPCIMPQYLNITADWQLENMPKENILFNSKTKTIYETRISYYTKTKKCLSCILFNKCKGIDKRYIKLYGIKEINPIKPYKKQLIKTTFI